MKKALALLMVMLLIFMGCICSHAEGCNPEVSEPAENVSEPVKDSLVLQENVDCDDVQFAADEECGEEAETDLPEESEAGKMSDDAETGDADNSDTDTVIGMAVLLMDAPLFDRIGGSELQIMEKDQLCSVFEYDTEWTHVRYHGEKGYVETRFITP